MDEREEITGRLWLSGNVLKFYGHAESAAPQFLSSHKKLFQDARAEVRQMKDSQTVMRFFNEHDELIADLIMDSDERLYAKGSYVESVGIFVEGLNYAMRFLDSLPDPVKA